MQAAATPMYTPSTVLSEATVAPPARHRARHLVNAQRYSTGGGTSSASRARSDPSRAQMAVARRRRGGVGDTSDTTSVASSVSERSDGSKRSDRRAHSKRVPGGRKKPHNKKKKRGKERRLTVVAIAYKQPKSHLGPFYTTIAELLVNMRGWRLKRKPMAPYDLILGQSIARGIPFARLAAAPPRGSRRPLANFYQGFKQLTWKVISLPPPPPPPPPRASARCVAP